jgi:hypothetical protein
MATRSVADRLVLSPQEPLVAGGPGEAFESQLRQVYRSGRRHVDHVSSPKARIMSVEIQADSREFPTTHVEGVFARNQIVWEPREISQSGNTIMKFHTWLDPRTSLEELSSQLMAEGAGVQSVAWEHPKRER